MLGDGNGWAHCSLGHRHWGRHGAAGLLLHSVDDAGQVRVLLQHRASWSHHGDTWGLPGGARDSHEDATSAALREASEEAGLDLARIRARHAYVDDHGGWSYTTIYADTPAPLPTRRTQESRALAWLTVDDVPRRSLHPGFAAAWDRLRATPTVLLVDAANVVGARPDGWWRDRPGAAARLLGQLEALRAATVLAPTGRTLVITSVVAVLEGAATRAADTRWVRVARAPSGSTGDEALVGMAGRLAAAGQDILAVTSDRALGARLGRVDRGGDRPPTVVGSRWLLDLLPGPGPAASAR